MNTIKCPYCEHEFEPDPSVHEGSFNGEDVIVECGSCCLSFTAMACMTVELRDPEKAPCLNGFDGPHRWGWQWVAPSSPPIIQMRCSLCKKIKEGSRKNLNEPLIH